MRHPKYCYAVLDRTIYRFDNHPDRDAWVAAAPEGEARKIVEGGAIPHRFKYGRLPPGWKMVDGPAEPSTQPKRGHRVSARLPRAHRDWARGLRSSDSTLAKSSPRRAYAVSGETVYRFASRKDRDAWVKDGTRAENRRAVASTDLNPTQRAGHRALASGRLVEIPKGYAERAAKER